MSPYGQVELTALLISENMFGLSILLCVGSGRGFVVRSQERVTPLNGRKSKPASFASDVMPHNE